MKSIFLILALVSLIIIPAYAQPDFTAYTAGNPVIPKGPAGWDVGLAFRPGLTVVNDTFYVCYNGSVNQQTQPVSIGLAISTDGYTFTKSPVNPILSGDGSGFDAYTVGNALLFYENGSWYLYYTGLAAAPNMPGRIISRAIADNPHGPWTRTDDTLLTGGSNGEWDDKIVNPLQILPTDTGLVMYYWGTDDFYPYTFIAQIGLATSIDGGQTWQKYDDPATTSPPFAESDPVLRAGPEGFDIDGIFGAGIVRDSNQWEMFYAGFVSNTEGSICYAASQDGIHWTKDPGNPIFTFWEDPLAVYGFLESPAVALYNSSYFLYYDYGNGPNSVGIGLATAPRLPGILNVPGQYATIQAAIDAAMEGDTVLVAEGTYYENLQIANKSIILGSHYLIDGDTSHISRTIIDGSQPLNPDLASVIRVRWSAEPTVICGFTITGGLGTKPPAIGNVRIGGGINAVRSSITISDNYIINNSIIGYDGANGGGICISPFEVDSLSIIIRNNVIANNYAESEMTYGGGIAIIHDYQNNFNYLIENNIIRDNIIQNIDEWKAMGGGIGLAFYLPTNGTHIIRNNLINGNEAHCQNSFGGAMYIIICESISGGSVDNDPGPYIYNNIIAGNHSDYLGGAVAVWRVYWPLGGDRAWPLTSAGHYTPKPSFVNNTIVNNTAQDGAGFYIMNHVPFLMNNILWNNYPSNATWGEMFLGDDSTWTAWVEPNSYGDAEVYYTDIQGGWSAGAGNIDSIPLLADTLLFHLSDSSPCIGAGIDSTEIGNIWYVCPSFCYYGNPRPDPIGSMPDIGACESPLPVGIQTDLHMISEKYLLSQNYPNPFNPSTQIKFQIPKSGFVTLKIYNLLGEEVATLLSVSLLSGFHSYEFDASELASGVYLYRLKAGEFIQTKKMILLR